MNFVRRALLLTIVYTLIVGAITFYLKSFYSLDREAEEFIYLSSIVKKVTEGKPTKLEQAKALTDWLSVNVKKVKKYPSWFDGSSVARVIKGGVGNCGFQTDNIITLSQYLGVRKFPTYQVSPQFGSKYLHVFPELIIDGKPSVFDPNLLGYVEDGAGNVLSLKEMMKNPSVVHNETFKKIVLELKEKPHIRQHRRLLKAPMPLGEGSYKIFARYGQTLTEMYLHFLAKPLAVLVLSWMFFLIFHLATQNLDLRDVVKRFKSS